MQCHRHPPNKSGTPNEPHCYYLERSRALFVLRRTPTLPHENWDSKMSLTILYSTSACFFILNVFPGTSSSSSTPLGTCILTALQCNDNARQNQVDLLLPRRLPLRGIEHATSSRRSHEVDLGLLPLIAHQERMELFLLGAAIRGKGRRVIERRVVKM